MKERRRAQRKKTNEFFGIYDRETDEFIGKLLYMSTLGIMISAVRSMIPETIYEFRIVLPKPIEELKHFTVDAQCVWCRPSASSNKRYDAGFHFTGINFEEIEAINYLLNDALFYDEEENHTGTSYRTTE